MIYLELFYEFFVVGLFVFGGGLATIPFLQQMAFRTEWFTITELMDMVAVAEATPGPIGINVATYVGYTVAGYLGGIVASIALLIPSITIALIVSRLLVKFKDSSTVKYILFGLKPVSLALMTYAALTVFSYAIFNVDISELFAMVLPSIDYKTIILTVVMFVAVFLLKKVHPIIFLAASAVFGIIFF
ncbi:MAG: chromate transporter [Oscillospiraceae bacterium]|jgi:chromate transporter|nr:chromate transporter [Oscillospiraceae bacterium]